MWGHISSPRAPENVHTKNRRHPLNTLFGVQNRLHYRRYLRAVYAKLFLQTAHDESEQFFRVVPKIKPNTHDRRSVEGSIISPHKAAIPSGTQLKRSRGMGDKVKLLRIRPADIPHGRRTNFAGCVRCRQAIHHRVVE